MPKKLYLPKLPHSKEVHHETHHNDYNHMLMHAAPVRLRGGERMDRRGDGGYADSCVQVVDKLRGELSTVEYAACDNGAMKTYEYKLADGGEVKQTEKEQMQGAEAEELPLTVSQFAKVYEDVREWARTPGNMEETVNPGLSISFINARYAYSGELDFGELAYVYSLSTRKITPLEGEYTGARAYGVISGCYPMVFIFIDK